MWPAIILLLQIFAMWLKNSFERDAEEKKRKEEMRVEAKEAIKSGDSSRISASIVRMRDK